MKKLTLLLLLMVSLVKAQDNNTISGDYKGFILIPGTNLQVIIHLTEDDRKLSGTIDIPQQNATGLKLEQIKYFKGELTYTIPEVPGNCLFKGNWIAGSDSLNGTFTQAGMSLPMRTKKINASDTQKEKQNLAEKIKLIEAYADSLRIKGDIAGMSIGILKDGEILLNKGFGYKDYENKINADENTLYAIGSCSKAFTTALLSTLNDEGVFDWETPVKKYVPYFEMKDPFANEQANAIDLCSHRTGLPRHDLVWYGSTSTRKELVERIKFMEPNKPFRTTWQYNNFMLMTAGVIAEEIKKDSWENLVQKRLFDKIGMKSTKIHFEDFSSTENKSKGYTVTDKKITAKPYRNIDAMGPAGSIFSSSTDMLAWTKMLLNKGKVNDTEVISASQIEFLLSPKMLMPQQGKDFKMLSYGLGWMIAEYKGKTVISHGGNIDGFTAYVALFPEDNMSVVVLTNKDGSSIPELFSIYANDRMNDRPAYDWYEETIGKSKKAAELKEAEAKKTAQTEKNKSVKNTKTENKKGPLHELHEYCGEYNDDAYGKVIISMVNKELVAKFHTFELKLTHDRFETFIAKMDDEEIKMNFYTTSTGKIEWFEMPLESSTSEIKFKRTVPDYLNDQAYLNKILGEYDFTDLIMTVCMEGKKLISKSNDGQHYELVPKSENTFSLKGIEGYTIEFVFDTTGKCNKIISHQPNGDFDAKHK